MARARILVVDDEEGMLEVYADTLRKLPDAEVVLESQSRRAAERLLRENFDLLITDIRMPGLDGVSLLRLARDHDPHLAALIITAFPTVDTAVESMKVGAADYIRKPFVPEDLLGTVQRQLEARRLREENRLLRRHVERPYAFGKIVGSSEAMRKVFESIERVSGTDFDVLIVGETGTGKELVARAIHERSSRGQGPFVPVDCGAIPETLMESELFGHERGAFTGAHTRSMGLLEFANKGTFFLDEVGQLPSRLQAKLLRVLQERQVRRVGSTKEIELDLRVIAASAPGLDREVQQGTFRRDFYYRINVTRIELPALRERAEDIPLLAKHFLTQYAKQADKGSVELSSEVSEVLVNYSWPGNVRELQNGMKRALAMAKQPVIALEDLPDEFVARAGESRPGEGFFQVRDRRMAGFEREYLRNLLAGCRGDVACAAIEGQLPRGTLYRLLRKHGLDPAEFRAEGVKASD